MARIKVQFRARKRWFFWPALVLIVMLGRVGILRNQRQAAKWIADHAMRIKVV